MKDILNVVLMTLSGVIIILTLLQSGKSDGLRLPLQEVEI